MNVLQYRDYQGEVAFEGDHLLVRILHIDDFITTEVDRASEAQAAFEELVDDYIVSCAELGKQPCKPFKGSFNVRMTPKLHKEIAFAAAEVGESLNSYVVNAVEEKLHATEVDKISDNVARQMAEYLARHSRTEIGVSPWKSGGLDISIVDVTEQLSGLAYRGLAIERLFVDDPLHGWQRANSD